MTLEKVPEGLEFTGKSMGAQNQHQSLTQGSRFWPQLLLGPHLTPLHTSQDNFPRGGARCVCLSKTRGLPPALVRKGGCGCPGGKLVPGLAEA